MDLTMNNEHGLGPEVGPLLKHGQCATIPSFPAPVAPFPASHAVPF